MKKRRTSFRIATLSSYRGFTEDLKEKGSSPHVVLQVEMLDQRTYRVAMPDMDDGEYGFFGGAFSQIHDFGVR